MKRNRRKLEHGERRGTGEEIYQKKAKNVRVEERCDEENGGGEGYEGEEMIFRRTG
jgi:hypothetical protein